MATFDDIAITDALQQLADFGEAAVYYKRPGVSRPIVVVANRRRADTAGEVTGVPADRMTVQAVNRAADGIASSEVDTGGDSIEIPWRIGDVAAKHRIVALPDDDAGMVTLELTK
jgi:hypothetical protein